MASNMSDMVGPRIKWYRHEEQIGSGRFGSVSIFRLREGQVESESLPGEMAVKLITGHTGLADRETDMCKHSHKNIILFYGVEQWRSLLYIKMEVAKYNLAFFQDKVFKGTFKATEFLYLALQMAEGLDFLHEHGICHRDIKRENVLVFWDEQYITLRNVTLKLCDFGLSRYIASESTTMTIVGTAKYTAPEVATALNINDPRIIINYQKVDIFSLGVLFYQLLFWEVPFSHAELVGNETQCIDLNRFSANNIEVLGAVLSQMLHWESMERISTAYLIPMLRACSKSAEQIKEQNELLLLQQQQDQVHRDRMANLEEAYSEQQNENQALQGRIAELLQANAERDERTVELQRQVARLKQQTDSLADGMTRRSEDAAELTLSETRSDFHQIKETPEFTIKIEHGPNELHQASKYGNIQYVRWLLSSGADVNKPDENGDTPLHQSCENGHLSVAQLLIFRDSKINQPNNSGMMPLHYACGNGHVLLVRLLIEKGADVNRANDIKVTPLHNACSNGHLSVVQLLIESGADVNKPDGCARTPLFQARRNGHRDIAALLIDKGAQKQDVHLLIGELHNRFVCQYASQSKFCQWLQASIAFVVFVIFALMWFFLGFYFDSI